MTMTLISLGYSLPHFDTTVTYWVPISNSKAARTTDSEYTCTTNRPMKNNVQLTVNERLYNRYDTPWAPYHHLEPSMPVSFYVKDAREPLNHANC